ncbi:ATP-binding protein [Streptomyces sp. 4N509B]|uniref:ATP-binding protein n=1 Tax=Streptomyces sp. 4N509B TaxID=3457413 RepID=UPI003FD2A666
MTISAPPISEPRLRIYHLATLNTPDAARLARDHVALLLRHTACPAEVDTARLLVSEIVTNAYQHTPTRVIRLTTSIRPAALRVAVYDTDPTPLPTPPPHPATAFSAEHGRGLALLQHCASSWGYKIHGGPQPTGKTVYFALHCPSR